MNEAGAVPNGLHSRSYDSEIIPFLSHHVKNPQLALPDKMSHSNLYGEDERWKLLFKNNNDGTRLLSEGDDVLYIITKLEKKSESRKKRTAGSGVWKGQTKGKEITSFIEGKEEVIGLKKTFSFELKKNEASLSNHMKELSCESAEIRLAPKRNS